MAIQYMLDEQSVIIQLFIFPLTCILTDISFTVQAQASLTKQLYITNNITTLNN